MTIPLWNDPKFGTMKSAALWLITVIEEGNVFTKADVAEAFPGVSQADRRVRELRKYGWRIDTNREDASLGQHEQRFVAAGEPVWEPGKGTRPGGSITETRRREVLLGDGNMCRSCGIALGEEYADGSEAAQIDIARRPVRQADGTETVQLVAECNRCRVGGRSVKVDFGSIEADLSQLGSFEREVLAGWIEKDQREFSAVERLWGVYRTLPQDSRERFRGVL
ncbi:hypothetical protein ABZT51_10080 [Streptomyces sp. NPDC005373]|uniref:hypothetical protein n=1 Tax=unclassified Streptomyces TaxID=2593676 RepID=UPI0033B2EAFF